MTIETIAIDDKTYKVSDLPEQIQGLIRTYDYVAEEVKSQQLKLFINDAALRQLNVDIKTAVEQFINQSNKKDSE